MDRVIMDILIKSFNRPYYLDRCLYSIYHHLKGDYKITVMDDGTPYQYIQKLKEKYPEVGFVFSEQVEEKRQAIHQNIENGSPINGFKIPTTLWKTTVQNSSDYVLVIEDDVWATEDIDLNLLIQEMKKHHIALLKLGWLGNYTQDTHCDTTSLTDTIARAQPKGLFTANKWIMDLLMYNKFKAFSILYKIGCVNNTTKQQYWALNSILMGLYLKEYWLAIWQDATGKVDEKQQLRNAAAWYHHHKKALFTRTKKEVLQTTFKSSATGSYHEYGNHFDVNRMNFILNEAWLNGSFNSMQNYPKDFSDDYITSFLDNENHRDALQSEWQLWATQFKAQYHKLGANVDN